jgi:hypothetical protein
VLALGDVSRVLLTPEQRASGATITGQFLDAQERRLDHQSAFVTSETFRSLRKRLGLGHP